MPPHGVALAPRSILQVLWKTDVVINFPKMYHGEDKHTTKSSLVSAKRTLQVSMKILEDYSDLFRLTEL